MAPANMTIGTETPKSGYFQPRDTSPLIGDAIDGDIMPAPAHIGDDGELNEDDEDEKNPAITSI